MNLLPQSDLLYYRAFQYGNQILPVNSVHWFIILIYHLHEAVARRVAFLMEIKRMILIMHHLHLTVILRHENIDVAIERVSIVSGTDYLRDSLGLAPHVVEIRQEVEFVKTVDRQHSTSSLSTRSRNP